MSETFYRKQGNKYVPIREYDPMFTDALPHGYWLLHVQSGGRSARREVHPNFIEVLAAFEIAKEAMSDAMLKAAEFTPNTSEPMTPKEEKAWKDFQKVMGKHGSVLRGASIMEIIDAGRDALIKALYVGQGPIQDKVNAAIKAMNAHKS